MWSDNQNGLTNRVTCHGLFKLLSTNFASSQEIHELSTESITPPHPTTCHGTVLPPWMLLSWLRMTSKQTKQVMETYSEAASKFSTADTRSLSISTYTNTCDLPLDLSTGVHALSTTVSCVEHNLLSKYTAWKPPITAGHTVHTTIQAQATASCSAYLMSMLNSVMETSTTNGRGQNVISVNSESLTKFDRRAVDGACSMASVSSEKSIPHRQMNGHTHAGPGKQPVTKCYQCKDLFPTLVELNAHFMREHSCILKTELEHAKSWKSHAVESMCFKLSAKQLHSEFEQKLIQGTVNSTGYPCPYCEYFAKWPTELQKHIMVHSKERPHRCVICGLSYKWKWDLGRHFDKSHHKGMNPYKKNGFVNNTITPGSRRDSRGRITASKLHGMKKGRRAGLLDSTTNQKTRTRNYQSEFNSNPLSYIEQHKCGNYTERTATTYTTNLTDPMVESTRNRYSIHS
ncbi:Zinc finger protein [Paragonimus skrjabini miyazakii]|uniref:Zinc finger protein n=1 Tax=Paragonimus skrjabini miyazakii TaxID=59628 RepID=A0A8S9Z123_9TREM|nr:Zinc finger protein [Paragonimus skrjabini miyazakii]